MLREMEQMPIDEAIRRAESSARIAAARIVLRIAEALGDWRAIEIAHGRLLWLETGFWLASKFGTPS